MSGPGAPAKDGLLSESERVRLSEKLSVGLTLLTAALAVAASFEGGLARVALNEKAGLSAALFLIVLSNLLSLLSWVFHMRWRLWLWLALISILLMFAGIGSGILSATRAAVAYDRPQVGAEYDGTVLRFQGVISLLPRDAEMTVTVHGYQPGCCTEPVDPEGSGEDRGSELYFATTGPDPTGTAKLAGEIPLSADRFEQVEVRVYRTSRDPNCLLNSLDGRQDRAACVTVWTQPRAPKISR